MGDDYCNHNFGVYYDDYGVIGYNEANDDDDEDDDDDDDDNDDDDHDHEVDGFDDHDYDEDDDDDDVCSDENIDNMMIMITSRRRR